MAAMLSWVVNAQAGNRTWNGGGDDNNWQTVANWGAAIQPNDLLFFAGSTRLTPFNGFGANQNFNALTFNSGAGPFTLSGSAINLGGGITNPNRC